MNEHSMPATFGTRSARIFVWIMVGATFVYLINNYLMYWQDWPGPRSLLSGEISALGILQVGFYVAAIALAVLYVTRRPETPLRQDSARLTHMVTFIVRWAFWVVFLVGVADAAVSFLRVEEMLGGFIGEELAAQFNYNSNRAPLVHAPLIGVALLLTLLFRGGLGFHWLALLVVIAELVIVLSRFIFSYEQAFMGDLVRFWYGALFLFASAYTLLDDGHVRVDVLYSGFRDTAKGRINAIGALLLGIIFCWVVLIMGFDGKNAMINAPIQSLEVTQSGFGMFVKYMMAGFLGVFAVSMMIAFCAQLLEGLADWRGDPGSRLHKNDGELPIH